MHPHTPAPLTRRLGTRRAARVVASGALALVAAATAAATLPAAEAMRSATTRTFTPVADVTVSGADNYQNFGTTRTLDASGNPIVRSYLKFTVTGASRGVLHASLRLRSLTSSVTGVSVSRVMGSSWNESMVFADAFALGGLLDTSGPTSANRNVDLDVTPEVTGDGDYAFVLTTTSDRRQSFASRETKTPPKLVVTIGAGAVAPAPTVEPTVAPLPEPTATVTPVPTVGPTATAAPSPTQSPTPLPAPQPVTTRALHIHHGFDLATPSQIARNATLIDSRPLDGVTVNLPTLSNDTLSDVAHSESEYVSALNPMPHLQKVTHNFVVVRTMHPLDWYSDAGWTTVTRNFTNLAKAASAQGAFDGIFLDTEYYGSGTYPWNYGQGSSPWVFSATGGATPGRSATDANATVGLRGRQVGDAVAAAWPDAAILTTYGPWVGETKTSSTGGWGGFGYNDTAWTNELMGSFAGGLQDAAAAHAGLTYVDGGEVYQAHTATEYATAYKWMKTGLAASGSVVVRSPSTYAANVSPGFGVYDKDMRVTGWPTMGASQWQSVMTNALKTADRYVWSYSEAYDWLNTGWPTTPVPGAILTATAAALAAAG
jgi:hypothetical protein